VIFCSFLTFQIYLSEAKIAETREKQKEFEKSSTELLEKLKKITDKRVRCEEAAKEMTTEAEQVRRGIFFVWPGTDVMIFG
jgi:chromosome segregation ATPase